MAKLNIVRIRGGINPLKGQGEMDSSSLSPEARDRLEQLFGGKQSLAPHGNEPVYRITRHGTSGTQTIDVPEHLMPPGMTGAVKDELP